MLNSDDDLDRLFDDIEDILSHDLPIDLDDEDVLSADWDDTNELYGDKLHEGYK